ncbi:hypothetical protein [Clostridium butyricum]|uniref:hypothetical protein n=1 Tax=Clostridium butyricum TaxID=1492 RepID=UPI00374E8F56
MERDGQIYIGINSLKESYVNLNLNMRSSNDDWNRAIQIFDDRIKGRFFRVINDIMDKENYNQDGFAIMALNCLLIETLMQFKEGYAETPQRRNKKEYAKFLRNEFPEIFRNQKIAGIFYTDIRCGILHSAETKNGSQLTFNKTYVIKEIGLNTIKVNVEQMTNILNEYYLNYIERLRDANENRLRISFLEKMDSICKK